MPTFVMKYDCPHCHATKAGLRGEFAIFTSKGCRIPLTCPHCYEVVVFPADFAYDEYRWSVHNNPNQIYNLEDSKGNCRRSGFPYPKPVIKDSPPHTPEKIDETFKEARDNLARGKLETCVLLCGKTIDLSTKSFDNTWKLEKRLKKLADDGLLTKDMSDWANEIRLDRNTAIHEDAIFTPEQAEVIVTFTEAFLTYVFTLPEMVKSHRASKEIQE